MKSRTTRLSALFIAPIVLASCGGGGTAAAPEEPNNIPVTPVTDNLAMKIGNRWVYQNTQYDSQDAPVIGYGLTRYTSANPLNGKPTLWRLSTFHPGAIGAKSRVMQTAAGVFDIADSAWWGDIPGQQPLKILPSPLTPTGPYTLVDLQDIETISDIDADGLFEHYSLGLQGEVMGTETVTVPAGIFENAIHVRTTKQLSFVYSSDLSTENLEQTVDDWFVFGYGIVKSVLHTVSSAGDTTNTFSLTGYRLGETSTDTTAPVVLDTIPWQSAVEPDVASIIVTFDEFIDPFLAANAITIVDQDGHNQGFGYDHTDNSIIIEPHESLYPGTYTVTVTGITDALGNPMAGSYTWSFTVY